jgi:mycothiol synthase
MTTFPSALPNNLIFRPPTRDDAQSIARGVIANEIAETGEAETIPEDVLELWENEEIDLQADARVLVTQKGEIIGYVGVSYDNRGFVLDAHTHIHPEYHHQGLEHFLLQFAEERARQQLEGKSTIHRLIMASSFSPTWTQLLIQEGYTVTSSDWRMEIVMHQTPPTPQSLEGITLRQYREGQEEAAIHAVVQEAFQDIGGYPYRPFEEWEQGVLKRSNFDSTLLYIALSEEAVVGAIICRSYPDQHMGHINQLAVLRPWRKRGIALQLLYTVFGEYYRRGMTTLILDVDSHNSTGAHQLYQRAGMHKSVQVDNMQKQI